MARRCYRRQLLRGSEGGARNHREDDSAYDETAQRDAECGPAGDGGRPEYLSLFSRNTWRSTDADSCRQACA